MTVPKTLNELQALLPNAAIEEVGERRELVIYTGLSRDDDMDTGDDCGLMPMPQEVD